LDHKRAVETLADLESRGDVNRLRVADLHAWPLLRLMLWGRLLQQDAPPATAPRAGSIPLPPRTFLQRLLDRSPLPLLPSSARAGIVFFSRQHDYGDRIGGSFYNRHLDPMTALFRETAAFAKCEIATTQALETQPRSIPTSFIEAPRDRGTPPAIEGFAALRDLGDLPLPTEQEFAKSARRLVRDRDFFLTLLRQLQPRVVFLVCYYDPEAMALIAAARQLGIRTVDVQHGKQGLYHGLYSHWTHIPECGYELLPDFFWVWGEPSRDHIARWQPTGCRHHRPIVGGNRWLARWQTADDFEPDPETTRFLAELRRPEKVILFSLQPLAEPLPAHVLDAMRRSPAGWRWLLRAHPHQRPQIPALKDRLTAAGAANFELEQSSAIPLYALLRRSQHHITCWSSVGYEASAFGVATTILHPSGRQLFAEEIERDVFSYADTGDALLAAIRAGAASASAVRYIETSDRIAQDALDQILAA